MKPGGGTLAFKEVSSSDQIVAGIKKYYRETIKPLEAAYRFDLFHSPHMTDTDFDALPMVLLIGQYSTGKTSFINYLVEKNFQGMNIGPEPTTDRFQAIMYGQDERAIPGNALAAMSDKPFVALQKFGMGFLNKFEGSICNSPVLKNLTFIDTPGVLSGEKQRIGRSYEFSEVIKWFAERADRILLLFDAHKLDISDEFKVAIEALANQDDKVKCVLNKADSISRSQLLRVYGALMWSLGRVIKTPEVLRVYCGSFWNKPCENKETEPLLKAEEADLIADLRGLSRNSAVRKVNELVKRARMAKVHAYIVSHLRDQFGWFGKDSLKKKLMEGIVDQFKIVQQKYNLAMGDFPNPAKFREFLAAHDIEKFPKLDEKLMKDVDHVLSVAIPNLLKLLPSPASNASYTQGMNPAFAFPPSSPSASVQPNYNPYAQGGADEAASAIQGFNPFAEDPDKAPVQENWIIDQKLQNEYHNTFFSLKLVSGKLSGMAAKDLLMQSGLQQTELRAIWTLADMDCDGFLDVDEFVVAQYLIDQRKRNQMTELPKQLEVRQIPPSKRHLFK